MDNKPRCGSEGLSLMTSASWALTFLLSYYYHEHKYYHNFKINLVRT